MTTEEILARLNHKLDNGDEWSRSDKHWTLSSIEKLLAENEKLRVWQYEVANGIGYLEQGEGHSGYRVADPETVVKAWKAKEYK